jgi:hypothetical protein
VKKFLVVGCGGSGGQTLTFIMDQLRADLKDRGIDDLPPAWQFLHIDVNPEPPKTKGLGSVRDLGGRYLSVSSPGNTFPLVEHKVEQSLQSKGALSALLGWAPPPQNQAAAQVPVTTGAGQYRAVGRMLTLTDLDDIRAALDTMYAQVQRPDAWGSLPTAYPANETFEDQVVPIVVASMAGGSGASMFLDISRMLGRIPGVDRSSLGIFLFTADVFASLPAGDRTGVDGNALGALGEIIAAQTRASDEVDAELYTAMGIPPEATNTPAFARVFPIGSAIGGDGARFGDGSSEGVFRGLGRALAATVGSSEASFQYLQSKIENPPQGGFDLNSLGWGNSASVFPWGSFGYASLSLGRDRYTEYAAQRLARNAFDDLERGHQRADDPLPDNEQIGALLDSQFSTILADLKLPQPGENTRTWFTAQALTDRTLTPESQLAVGDAVGMLSTIDAGQAEAWVQVVRQRLDSLQRGTGERIDNAVYQWANAWANSLEEDILVAFRTAMTQVSIPYAKAMVVRLRAHLDPHVEQLRSANASAQRPPLEMDADIAARAAALKKTVIGAGHALADTISLGFLNSARKAMVVRGAGLAGDVLAAYCSDVLGALERAAEEAKGALETARSATASEAGLAQLKTTAYPEWPREGAPVPARFDHADNEVLLTTSADFTARFEQDVLAAVPNASLFDAARKALVGEIKSGQWESSGALRGEFPVVIPTSRWIPACLPRDPATGEGRTKNVPAYTLAVRTPELLDRARANLSRPGPFADYSSQTIEDYLDQEGLTPEQREVRAAEFVAKFKEAMSLARPLVGVSPPMIQQVHDASLLYQYSFSAIPIAGGAGTVSERIVANLQADPTLDSSTEQRFVASLKPTSQQKRIAIFGSYPPYSPLVFSSLLDQIQQRWSGAADQAKQSLWQWKRTRPLPGSIAMGAIEQRVMIEGWFLGRLIGSVVLPKDRLVNEPAQVFDAARSAWMSFPNPLMTPPRAFRSPDDWLPAVLESHSLALVQCNGDVQLTALRPYVALRGISDDTVAKPQSGFGDTSGDRMLEAWLTTGAGPSGQPSQVGGLENVATMSREERAAAALDWLRKVAKHVSDTYLTDGGGVGVLAVRRPRVNDVSDLARMPMFGEVAGLAFSVLGGLIEKVERLQASGGGGVDIM